MIKILAFIAVIASFAVHQVAAALPETTKLLAIRATCSRDPVTNIIWTTAGLYADVLMVGGSGHAGHASMQGSQTGDTSQEIKFTPEERVLVTTLWHDGKFRKLGHIYLKTDRQEFDVGMKKPKHGYQIDVGSGLLVGALGVTSDYIVDLSFLFLSCKIESVSISDIKFVSDPRGTSVNLAPSYLIRSTMGNPSGSADNVSFSVTGTEKVMQSTTWLQSSTESLGGSIEVQVSSTILGVGTSVTGGFTWTDSDTSSQSTLISDEVTLTLTAGPFSIAPGHGKACQMFAQKGDGSFPYTSTVTLNLDDGQKIPYQEDGKLLSVQYSKVQAICTDANDPKDWNEFNEVNIPAYAILSHTWGEGEVLFQDFEKPSSRTLTGYTKITKCCEVARSDGWQFVWVDTCCIDKTSSAELSEAINSMYLWYQEAQVCYVYMVDVELWSAVEFQASRWFKRGWTLQELLAPNIVIFYNSYWEELGTKSSLESLVSGATIIARKHLQTPAEASVAS
ncbi:hypothetical protein Q9189_004228 [Teloschistes chrysophthalmus]